MRGERSRRGGSSTTRSGHTAAWDTKPRKSLLLLRPQASTPLSERQGTQTPSLAPRAPPSRLKPEREQQKVVVFLRERKLGAGQFGNVMLIARQKPDASNVAGIRTWNSLGRFVKRGEKGILILAPMVGYRRSRQN